MTLLKTPEGKTLEFKRDLSSPEGVLRALIAFANTAGGTLVIGVEDKKQIICGVEDPLALEERLSNVISDSISPKLIPNMEICTWRNIYLLVVQIYPSNTRPHYLKNKGLEKGTYVRIGSSNRLADSALIAELQRMVKSEAYDEQPMPDLNSEALDFRAASESFAQQRKLKLSDLLILKLLTKYQGQSVPTIGGMLLFGKDRLHYFNDAWIQAGRFSGVNRNSILDTREITVYPVQAIDEVLDFVKKHAMRRIEMPNGVSHFEIGTGTNSNSLSRHKEIWSIPLIAIREAIINAVVHADYTQQGAPIRLSLFDDRIEIENPGLIPFNLTLEDLYRGISKLRNPVLGRVFHEIKLIERWGSGISKILEACANAGLKKPKFEEIGCHFRVTIFSQLEHAIRLDELDQAILALFKEGQGLSTQQIASQISLSPRATRSRLIKLIDRDFLVELGKSPKDPGRKYFLIK